MTKTILAYGDSNTYGTPPALVAGENRRFDAATRWPGVMQENLGEGYTVIEEGLPGRTTVLADPVKGPHLDGQVGLRIALESHGPIDLLIIMLGTNDAQTHYARSAAQIAAGVAALIAIAKSEPYQLRHEGFEILIVAPPPVLEEGTYKEFLLDAAATSHDFAPAMRRIAEHWGVAFFDAAGHAASSPIDGVHFTAEDHIALGRALAEKVRSL
ncbi:SGNH/GDSL hydrolase family protein [Yoonia litorea]|uniref:Lysophospholipase L1 n=1 Tax=Yoonia litorea TaxID=1123755 RepID=A0A1I6MXB5_9RHOB|nr:SGNH/GDSL hydrolase family protein [Yoonia litorea]SFS20355.1 Lysophospholipase L1 [Yoonia litorea]